MILQKFSWTDLNLSQQQHIADAIKHKIEVSSYKKCDNNSDTLKSLIYSCLSEYKGANNKPILIYNKDKDHEDNIVKYAIYLAIHAVISSVYQELPQQVTYILLQLWLLQEHAKLIQEMLLLA